VALITVSLVAAFAYFSEYELRLVPNKPDLRPKAARPQPQELQAEFKLEGGSERDNRGFPQREIVDLASAYPGIFFREGDPKKKQVALTFDDGPDSVYTPQMLDVLSRHQVKGTFF
jgi:peptidoglycan/xylan/chitin deacetylase (PgdA/CDA1 family)